MYTTMGIILPFLCFISPYRPCLFFMYLVIFQRALPRSYDIVRIYLVLIAYYMSTPLVHCDTLTAVHTLARNVYKDCPLQSLEITHYTHLFSSGS